MKGPVNETEGPAMGGKELREYSVLEAKKKKERRKKPNKTASSRKMQSTVSTVEKQDKDGRVSIRYSNNEAISDLGAGRAGLVVKQGRSHTIKC